MMTMRGVICEKKRICDCVNKCVTIEFVVKIQRDGWTRQNLHGA